MMSDFDLNVDDTIRDAFKEIQERGSYGDEEAPNETHEDQHVEANANDEESHTDANSQSTSAEDQPKINEARDIQRDTFEQAPSSWKAQTKAKWQSLDPEIRAEILRRETDYFKGYEQIKPNAALGKTIDEIVKPYQQMIAAEGGTTETAVRNLFQTAAILRNGTQEQKLSLFSNLARQYSVDIGRLFQQPGQQQQFQQAAPIPPEMTALSQQIQQMYGAMTQQQQQQKQVEFTNLQGAADKWLSESKNGKPLRPYFANVENEVISKVGAIRAGNPQWSIEKVLQEAYDRAVWENPDTRAALLAEQEAAKKQTEENLRKAREAKRLNKGNISARGMLDSKDKKGSMEDTIRETYRQITS
jgi:hypothetical protein